MADAIVTAKAPSAPSRFVLCYSRALADRLGYLELEVAGKAQDGWARLPDAEVGALGGGGGGAGCFAVPLDADAGEALAAGSSEVSAYAAFARAVAPRPSAVAQGDPQHVLFTDAALRAVSPYRVEKQTVEAQLPPGRGGAGGSDAKPLSFFPGGPVGRLQPAPASGPSAGRVLKFSPSGATAPWAALGAEVRAADGGAKDAAPPSSSSNNSSSPAALSVHYALEEPLVRGLRVVREIEVSHWGNVYVEESYLVRNDGPLVDGEFSRRRYGDRSAHVPHMFENLRARLPAGSRWIYFRDAIGNISTSAVFRVPKGAHVAAGERARGGGRALPEGGVVVDLGMRYPMLGGWRCDFVLGYSLPLSAVVSRVPAASPAAAGGGVGGRMRLRVPLPAPVEGMYVDDLEVRVVLPEGARAVAHRAPSAPNAAPALERKSTYLDAPWGPGRPVLVLRLPNGVPDHASGRLTVEYTIGALDLARKPLLLVAAYGAVFAALALYNRADFSIAPSPGRRGEGAAGGGRKAKAA